MSSAFFRIVCLALLLTAALAHEPSPAAAPDTSAPPYRDGHGDPLPPGAIARLGTVRWRQPQRDESHFARIGFSRDGKILAAVGADGLCLWDTATGRPVPWLPDGSRMRAALFAADGKTLITQSDRALEHWEVGTGKRLRRSPLTLSLGVYVTPALSANGKLFALNDRQYRLHLLDAWTGKHLVQMEKELNPRHPVCLSANGRIVALVDRDGSLCLFDGASGKERRRFLSKEGAAFADHYFPALAPSGKLLAASTLNSLRVWDTATGELKREFKHCHGVAAFSGDGKYLACGGHEAIYLWDTVTFREVRRFEGKSGEVRGLAFSTDGRLLASAQEHAITLWDLATGKQRSFLPAHQAPVYSLTFTPSGKQLISGGGDGTAIVWDLATAQPRLRLTGHYEGVSALACSPDGKLLATGDGGPCNGTEPCEAQVRLWRLDDGKRVRQFMGHLHSINSLAFTPDGRRLASAGPDGRFRMWDPATGKRLYQVRCGEGNRTLAFAPDGKTLLAGSTRGELSLWRADTGHRLRDLGVQGKPGRYVIATQYLPDGKTVISEEQDDSGEVVSLLRFWDAGSGREVRTFPLKGATRYLEYDPAGHCVSPDGTLWARVANNYSRPDIQLWDLSTGKLMAELKGHAGLIRVLAFAPDGKLLASGSEDTTVLIWDVEQARVRHCWLELLRGTPDAGRRAALAADPTRAAVFLKDHLSRAAAVEARARSLLVQLDDDHFAVREKASRELQRLGPGVEILLRQTARESTSPEVRKRVQTILKRWKNAPTTETLDLARTHLAVTLLEKIATPAAERALEELARGPEGTEVTRAARAALEHRKKPTRTR